MKQYTKQIFATSDLLATDRLAEDTIYFSSPKLEAIIIIIIIALFKRDIKSHALFQSKRSPEKNYSIFISD